ncbi:MAG: hypothetical protein ACYS0I_18785, partial [Planctomycetota bacterium]
DKDPDGAGPLVGETWSWTISSGPITANPTVFVATGSGIDPLGNVITFPGDPDEQDDVTVEVVVPQGCTPGFWKNHPDCWHACWPRTGGDPEDDLVGTVFAAPGNLNGKGGPDTLMDALEYKGGKGVEGASRILLRQAVAALLNACDPDISYFIPNAIGPGGVIETVNAALATGDRTQILDLADMLDEYNNKGCPIDAHCNVIDD